VRKLRWDDRVDPSVQVVSFSAQASETGILIAEFESCGGGPGLSWAALEPWTRSRAVTLAVVEGPLASPALDVALCSDLVYLLPASRLRLARGPGAPAPGVIWALGRAGRRALARGLLSTADLSAAEAVDIGIAHEVIRDRAALPFPDSASMTAATTARDLMRSRDSGGSGLALELASFRLLFAAGDPGEGARAFLEKRESSF
jgi:enoyl-CoA hydratase/carnithine racemase